MLKFWMKRLKILKMLVYLNKFIYFNVFLNNITKGIFMKVIIFERESEDKYFK